MTEKNRSAQNVTDVSFFCSDGFIVLNSICIVKRDKTLPLCGANSFLFFSSREVCIDLVRTLFCTTCKRCWFYGPSCVIFMMVQSIGPSGLSTKTVVV